MFTQDEELQTTLLRGRHGDVPQQPPPLLSPGGAGADSPFDHETTTRRRTGLSPATTSTHTHSWMGVM